MLDARESGSTVPVVSTVTGSRRLSTLRVKLITAFTGLFFVLVTAIVGINTYSGYRTSIEVANDLFARQSRQIINRTLTYLWEADQSAHVMSRHLSAELVPLTQSRDEVVNYAFELLLAYPAVSGIYYGDAYGLWGACVEDTDLYCRAWRWKDDLSRDISFGRYVYVDEIGNVQNEKKFEDTWNTLLRPWYIKSRGVSKPYWSDPYVFKTDNADVGISAVHDVFNSEGVVTGITVSDITLQKLSEFLDEHKVGKRGLGLIVDKNGTIVCAPRLEEVIVKADGGGVRLKSIVELVEYPFLIDAFSQHVRTGQAQLRVSEDGTDHLVDFSDFPDSFGRSWKLILAAPAEEFVSTTKHNALMSAVLSLVLFLLGIILISLISNRISEPIVRLTEETEKIQNLALEGEIEVRSPILEIDMIAGSISRLKVGLRSFQKYVPSLLVKELVRTGEDARLGGHQEILTIFFSDIAGFTPISEQLPPEYLSLHLSDYFNELTKIVQECGGTVDKYIGDSIMAFWGAPVPDQRQEENACRAALLVKRRLLELNASWKDYRKPPLPTRIGIHTGPTVVGNVGAEDRMNYTILGDSVNVASRLEGINKVFGTAVIVSENTFVKLDDTFIGRPLDYVAVKGRTEPVKIFELMDLNDGGASDQDKTFCEEFTSAFSHFNARRWEKALEHVAIVLELKPDDFAARQLQHRCILYKDSPPSDDWFGFCGDVLSDLKSGGSS